MPIIPAHSLCTLRVNWHEAIVEQDDFEVRRGTFSYPDRAVQVTVKVFLKSSTQWEINYDADRNKWNTMRTLLIDSGRDENQDFAFIIVDNLVIEDELGHLQNLIRLALLRERESEQNKDNYHLTDDQWKNLNAHAINNPQEFQWSRIGLRGLTANPIFPLSNMLPAHLTPNHNQHPDIGSEWRKVHGNMKLFINWDEKAIVDLNDFKLVRRAILSHDSEYKFDKPTDGDERVTIKIFFKPLTGSTWVMDYQRDHQRWARLKGEREYFIDSIKAEDYAIIVLNNAVPDKDWEYLKATIEEGLDRKNVHYALDSERLKDLKAYAIRNPQEFKWIKDNQRGWSVEPLFSLQEMLLASQVYVINHPATISMRCPSALEHA